LADQRIGACALDILDAEVSIIVLILSRRVGLLSALVIDDVILGDDGLIGCPLKMFFVGGYEGIDSLGHLGCVYWYFPIIECGIGKIKLMGIVVVAVIGGIMCVIAHLSI
jgi:hypothetical protein